MFEGSFSNVAALELVGGFFIKLAGIHNWDKLYNCLDFGELDFFYKVTELGDINLRTKLF